MEEIIHPQGKVYYSMGEVCEIFGVNASLLRFWEEEFPMLKITKNSRGHRRYTTKDVDNIRLIYHLVKEQGMTLEGARRRMRNNPEGINHDAEIVERLKKIRNMLVALKAEMGIDTEVIEVEVEDDEYDVAELDNHLTLDNEVAAALQVDEAVAEVEPATIEPKVEPATAEPKVEPAAAVEQEVEQLADFRMESQSSQPAAEETPKKHHKTPKVGTLIGGNLFSPEDIRLAVAKKNSKEAKNQNQVIEQTLF